MSAASEAPSRRNPPVARVVRAVIALSVGTVLCLLALTSVLVLGWQMRLVRARVRRLAGRDDVEAPGWILGARGRGVLVRALGGLAANAREGASAALGLSVAAFPYAAFWLAGWWGGWENSFNKGYEQAFVGPLLGLVGIGVFAVTMVYLPMALAHQAVENRSFAMFELRRVRSLVAHAGWRYSAWALAALVLALPIFAARGLPVFAEGIAPDIADRTIEEIAALRGRIELATAAYVFLATTSLRVSCATLYLRAALRARAGRDAKLWAGAEVGSARGHDGVGRAPWRTVRWAHGAVLIAAWTGVAVLIFVGQFLNHEWHIWASHPFVFLPWGG